MVVIRGMNVFPSAIEQILRESQGVGEFRITFYTDGAASSKRRRRAGTRWATSTSASTP
jgi:hypothetical protein